MPPSGSRVRVLTEEQVWSRIRRWCAFRDRSIAETRAKLKEWGAQASLFPEIISSLIADGYLNEERFALSYARGKFNYNGWGPEKIKMGLKQAGVKGELAKEALSSVDKEAQKEKAQKLAKISYERSSGEAVLRRAKVIRYLRSKGYSMELIKECLHSLKLESVLENA